MDPGWPANPPGTLICVLCKAAIPFDTENEDQFMMHLMMDHSTFFNLNLVVELSLRQPGADHHRQALVNTPSTITDDEISSRTNVETDLRDDTDSTIDQQEEQNLLRLQSLQSHREQDMEDVGLDFHLDYLMDQLTCEEEGVDLNSQLISLTPRRQGVPGDAFVPAFASNTFISSCAFTGPPVPDDFSHLDPISFVVPEPRKKTRQQLVNKNNQPRPAPLPANPNRHLVSEDSPASVSVAMNPNRHLVPDNLQQLITSTNPGRVIKFTYSQRLNTQMVLDEYVLKKKRGPYLARGGRVVNWRCIDDKCPYTAITWEGEIQDATKCHNHSAQPELYAKKQARYKIRENMASHLDQPTSYLVDSVVEDTHPEMRNMIGSIDALKQAARRYTRKIKGAEPRPRRQRSCRRSFLPVIPGIDPDTNVIEIIENLDDEKPANNVDILNSYSLSNLSYAQPDRDLMPMNVVNCEEVIKTKIEIIEEVDVELHCDLESFDIEINIYKEAIVEDEVLNDMSEELMRTTNFPINQFKHVDVNLALKQQLKLEKALPAVYSDCVEEDLEPSPSMFEPLRDVLCTKC